MFTFCDFLHEAKQKHKLTLESVQYGLEISFKPHRVPYFEFSSCMTLKWQPN